MNDLLEIEGIGAELLGAHSRPPRRFPPGRMCAHRGCRTVLSVYNGRPMCARHDFCSEAIQVHRLDARRAHLPSGVVRTKRAA